MEEYSLADVLNIPLIKESRDGYKAFGKDPSRYRLVCESLLRRLVKGRGALLDQQSRGCGECFVDHGKAFRRRSRL